MTNYLYQLYMCDGSWWVWLLVNLKRVRLEVFYLPGSCSHPEVQHISEVWGLTSHVQSRASHRLAPSSVEISWFVQLGTGTGENCNLKIPNNPAIKKSKDLLPPGAIVTSAKTSSRSQGKPWSTAVGWKHPSVNIDRNTQNHFPLTREESELWNFVFELQCYSGQQYSVY